MQYNDDNSSESDGEYIPDVEQEVDNDSEGEEGDPGLVEENVDELLQQNYVDGGWEPFRSSEKYVDEEGAHMGKLLKKGEVYDDAEFGRISLRPWQLFVDKDHFKEALRDYCIQEGFSLVVRKSEIDRYTAECADIRCNWRIHATVLQDGFTWAIKSIKHGHTCDLNMVNNPMCNCKWAAQKLLEDIRASPDIKGKALNQLLWERFGITMACSSLYKMRSIAMDLIQGGHDESYHKLNLYCHLMEERNPGTVAFSQFEGLIGGCRGLVGVDGFHLKGNYGGILLSAVSLDGNNEIFPVAVAVVDSENKQSWSWFFHHPKNTLTATGRVDWTIMSDRQKGIDPALDQVWPKVPRRYCARHLCKNFKADYPGILMHKLFWGVTNAYSAFSFKKALQKVQTTAGLGAVKWFKEVGPLERWTRWRFDPQLSSDENTNNFVESFNNTIGVDRCYPILTLLEGIRRIAMVRHASRQQLAEQWIDEGICPNIRERVRALTKESRLCHAYPSRRGEYEVSDGRSMLPVSLNSWSCVCGRWQVSGIPCRHGIRAILDAGKDPTDFVREWYSVARYKLAYSGNILPIPSPEQWPDMDVPNLVPPPMKRSVGRPSRNRRREEGEKRKGKRSATVQCKKCKQHGHNAATCKGGLTKKEKQARQGKTPSTATKGKTPSTASRGKRTTQQTSQSEMDFNMI
ncbi:uncharacterized protein LOC110717599 [Chenopodium quinoa]|uniref:uncharacterized protein LOC110717599 n=1 Tax=Chenopodium quinoa TaxID=63459 RepID=UPI000B79765E|nr:uncharacterized protein LOC110717599 [Chenopodium quinoa]